MAAAHRATGKAPAVRVRPIAVAVRRIAPARAAAILARAQVRAIDEKAYRVASGMGALLVR